MAGSPSWDRSVARELESSAFSRFLSSGAHGAPSVGSPARSASRKPSTLPLLAAAAFMPATHLQPNRPQHSRAPLTGLRLGFFDNLAKGFENDDRLQNSRPDYTEGLSKNAPGYVKKAKREYMNKMAANYVTVKFASGKGGLIKPGSSLLSEARKHGMKVPSYCLRGECGTCRVKLDGRVVKSCVTKIEKPMYTKALNVGYK